MNKSTGARSNNNPWEPYKPFSIDDKEHDFYYFNYCEINLPNSPRSETLIAVDKGFEILDKSLLEETNDIFFPTQYKDYTDYYSVHKKCYDISCEKLDSWYDYTNACKDIVNAIPTVLTLITSMSGNAPPCENAANTIINLYGPDSPQGELITSKPDYPQSSDNREASAIMEYYCKNKQFAFLINDSKVREQYLENLEMLQSDLINYDITDYENQIIQDMINDIIYMNENFDQYNCVLSSNINNIQELYSGGK